MLFHQQIIKSEGEKTVLQLVVKSCNIFWGKTQVYIANDNPARPDSSNIPSSLMWKAARGKDCHSFCDSCAKQHRSEYY